MLKPNDYIIQRFEVNNPHLVKIIEDWTKISIEYDLEDIKIVLNKENMPDYPENFWDDKIQRNSVYNYMMKKQELISEYLLAKGFPAVGYTKSSTTLYVKGSNGRKPLHECGYIITAYIKKPE